MAYLCADTHNFQILNLVDVVMRDFCFPNQKLV